MTHDYKRNGGSTLFAALHVKSGLANGDCIPRHRTREFLTLQRRSIRNPSEIQLLLDNYASEKTPEGQEWLAKQQHFTPTSVARMKLAERFFA